jgi:hypothetical protein
LQQLSALLFCFFAFFCFLGCFCVYWVERVFKERKTSGERPWQQQKEKGEENKEKMIPFCIMGRRKKRELLVWNNNPMNMEEVQVVLTSSSSSSFSCSSSSSSNSMRSFCNALLVRIVVIWSSLVLSAAALGTLQSDVEGLQRFREAVDPTGMLLSTWVNASEVCTGSWLGVDCSEGRVYSLRLPLSGLVGIIPNNSLGLVDQLRVVSLHNNFLTGAFPGELGNCSNLRALYLASNSFYGPLPSLLGFWPRLTHLSLGFNNFSGAITDTVDFFQELYLLDLENNSFSGMLPALKLNALQKLTLQNNNLSGPIPPSLQSFPAADFAGNPNLCGPPTPIPCSAAITPAPAPSPQAPSTAPIPSTHSGRKKLAAAYIAAIAVGSFVFVVLLATAILVCCWCWRRASLGAREKAAGAKGSEKSSDDKSPEDETNKDENSSSAQGELEGGVGGRNKLVFFQGKNYSFDLEDLLRASAEVLGKGSVGTAYKAVLEDGTIVAVKRLKDVVTPRRDFELQIALVGTLQHPNVVPLRAYYFSKEEKLLVYEYYSNGSLSAFLHGMYLLTHFYVTRECTPL